MDAIRPLACRPRAFTTMSLDRRFESVASIEFHDYDYVAENSTLAPIRRGSIFFTFNRSYAPACGV